MSGAPAPGLSDSRSAAGFDNAKSASKKRQKRHPVTPASPTEHLRARLDVTLGDRRGDVSAAATDLRTGESVSYGQTAGMATASVSKLDILVTLLLTRQDQDDQLSEDERETAAAMIQNSDNAAADTLWDQVGQGPGVAAVNQRLGLTDTVPGLDSYWGSTTTSATDQVRLIGAVVRADSQLQSPRRAYALSLLRSVEDDQEWGVSRAGDPGSAAVKNGWLPRQVDGYRWVVDSVGTVSIHGDPTLVAVLSRGSATEDDGIALIEGVSVAMRDVLVAPGSSAP